MSIHLPAFCRICHQYHHNRYAICQDCINLFEPLGLACRSCAKPLPQANPAICEACMRNPPILDRVFIAYRYTEPLRTLLHAFKYDSALYLTSLLSFLILQAVGNQLDTECLIPIPLHKKRIQTRGFNQTALLTQYVGHKLQKPYLLQKCMKIIATPAQAHSNAKQRQTNLLHAFQAKKIPYTHITLIDDLYTTGATANAVAKAFKQTGVERVDLWCCARADKPESINQHELKPKW